MASQPVPFLALFLTKAPIQTHNIHFKNCIVSSTNLFDSHDDAETDDLSSLFPFQLPASFDTKEKIIPALYILFIAFLNLFLKSTTSIILDVLFFGYITFTKSLSLGSGDDIDDAIDDAKSIEISYFLSLCGSFISAGIIAPEGISLQSGRVNPISILLLVVVFFISVKKDGAREVEPTVTEENSSRELMREWDKKFSDLNDSNNSS
jgi:hypothetical protein